MLLLNAADFGSAPRTQRELKITIPEGLDYEGIFDDLLLKYTTRAELERVVAESWFRLEDFNRTLEHLAAFRKAGGKPVRAVLSR